MALIFHASDLHFGREDRAALRWFEEEVRRDKPAAIIITGDLTSRARQAEFAAARDWLAALPAPVSVEVGNHDIPYFNPAARFLTPYRRYGLVEQFVERPFELPGVEIVPLATTARWQWRLDWSKGQVSRERLRIALDRLKASDRAQRLIACHHPLHEPGTQGTAHTRRGIQALTALAEAGATAVLSGHVHDPFDRLVQVRGRQIRLIGAGTLSERVRAARPSYNAIRAGGGMLDVEIRHQGET